jgi:hypothetical protein
LQSIFDDFEDYVRKNNINYGKFYGDNGSSWDFLIAKTDLPFKTTSIGARWYTFATILGFEEGDIINFKFGHPLSLSSFPIVHVYKV